MLVAKTQQNNKICNFSPICNGISDSVTPIGPPLSVAMENLLYNQRSDAKLWMEI